MTPKEQAAMQQALEALCQLHFAATERDKKNRVRWFDKAIDESVEAITAMREVLERPVSQEQNSMFMEGYRIGLAEMREKCATVSEQGTGEAVQKTALELLLNERKRIAAAIRAIKFEGDTGFRPVSEMIAEHKQDPKKGAAIEKAKVRKATRAEKIAMPGVYEVPVERAEQEPVGVVTKESLDGVVKWNGWIPREGTKLYAAPVQQAEQEPVGVFANVNALTPEKGARWEQMIDSAYDGVEYIYLYAAPVRTKDLTDEEIVKVMETWGTAFMNLDPDTAPDPDVYIARAVIAADREKNK